MFKAEIYQLGDSLQHGLYNFDKDIFVLQLYTDIYIYTVHMF